MNFTDKLSIDLNDDTFFSDKVMFQSKENPKFTLSNQIKFSDKTREEIINEVAQRARRAFGFE